MSVYIYDLNARLPAMNIISLIKITTTSAAIAASTLLISCVQPTGQQQAGVSNQPQASAAANPYAVPGLGGQTPAPAPAQNYPNYSGQTNTPAPYQPLPGVPSDVPNIQTPAPTPSSGTSSASTGATTHDVIRGESLWRISRKYGVSIEAIQQANGLKDNNIWAGQKLNIPAGN